MTKIQWILTRISAGSRGAAAVGYHFAPRKRHRTPENRRQWIILPTFLPHSSRSGRRLRRYGYDTGDAGSVAHARSVQQNHCHSPLSQGPCGNEPEKASRSPRKSAGEAAENIRIWKSQRNDRYSPATASSNFCARERSCPWETGRTAVTFWWNFHRMTASAGFGMQ